MTKLSDASQKPSDMEVFNDLMRKDPILAKWLACFTDFRSVLQNYYEVLRPIVGSKSTTLRMMKVVQGVEQMVKPIEHLLDEYDRYIVMINALTDDLAKDTEPETDLNEGCHRTAIQQRLLPPSSKRLLARNGGAH